MKNLAIILALAVFSIFVYAFSEKEKSKRYEYLGQTIPPDMEFIPGNDSIPSFFISKSQETNLNWTIYLDWLQRVYIDYREVVTLATPHEVPEGELYKFNDPILRGQLRNPAFAYYPVTGVDWVQIQDYMFWKTDRLNESILIRLNYLKSNPYQINEDNFNFEAYMAGQYEGVVVRKVPGKLDHMNYVSGYQDQAFGKVFPFLFPGYRLATEAEWEYAAKDAYRNTTLSGANTYPYGRKFFLFDYLFEDMLGNKNILFANYVKQAGTCEPADMARVRGGTTYDNSIYGVYNMGNNVKEWMMDEYTPAVKYYPNTESVYTDNGFLTAADSMYKDEDGHLREKDTLGRMYYRTMGIANNGNDFRVMGYGFKLYKTHVTKYPNLDSAKVRVLQKETLTNSLRASAYIPWASYPNYWNWTNLHLYKIKEEIYEGKKTERLVLDTAKLIDSLMNSPLYINQRKFITISHREPLYLSDTAPRRRVVKSGTWKNPSVTARESMLETDASADVGFRTVIPYMGIPIDKKNKVKWK